MAKRIGLLTCGGDAPGQNVCLKSIVYSAVDRGFEVLGIRKGWEGLLHYNPDDVRTRGDNIMSLTKVVVRDIDRMPGSLLHSSRLNPGSLSPESVPAFLRSKGREAPATDMTDHIKHVVAKLEMDGLIVLGDRRGLDYAARLQQQGVPTVGIPKTVHNDVSGSDYTLGFSSALGRGVRLINEIRAMAASREEIGVVEILSWTTGLTTMLIAFLAGVDRTLIPEAPFDPEKLAKMLVNDKQTNPNNYAILTLSEATSLVTEKVNQYLPDLSRLANSRMLEAAMTSGESASVGTRIRIEMAGRRAVGTHVSGTGAVVTEILENLIGQRLLFQPLSYLIRTGEPDGQDLLGAMNFATLAVQLFAEGKTGQLVAYRRRDNYVDVPLDTVNEPLGNIRLADFYDSDKYYAKPGILWAARA